MFTQAKKKRQVDQEQQKVMDLRWAMYDKFLKFIKVYISEILIETLQNSIHVFNEVFASKEDAP